MAGAWASYQGLPCSSVAFRRARGYGSDSSVVEIPASALLEVRRAADLGKPVEVKKEKLDAIQAPGAGRAADLGDVLEAEGTLHLAWVDDAGQTREVAVVLFVQRVESAQVDSRGVVTLWRVNLADPRLFWARGVVRRWSFNRLQADGAIAPDSLRPDGQRWTLAQVAREVVAPALFRAQGIAALPGDWETERPAIELARFDLGGAALARLVAEAGLEDACLRLDGTVALHEAEDGFLGYAPEGKGANRVEFPAWALLDEDGAGQGRVLELGWPEEYLLVVGGLTIRTVVLDHWTPILMRSDGRVVPLTEATVRRFTRNRYGLEWLRRLVVAPASFQSSEGVEADVLTAFRTQAWRLFQLPGASAYADDGTPSRGPNAHLLPLLSRAEAQGLRRGGVLVETFRFETVTRDLEVSEEDAEIANANRNVNSASEEIRDFAKKHGVPSPWDLPRVARARALEPRFLTQGIPEADFHAFYGEAVTTARARGVDPALGNAYDEAITARLAARDKRDGTRSRLVYDLAKEFRDLEQIQPDDPAAKERLALFERHATSVAEQLAHDAEERRRAAARGEPGPKKKVRTFAFRGHARAVDAEAVVVDAERGIVRTGELAGWLVDLSVPHAGATLFEPMPVRVSFGSTVRPAGGASRPGTTGADAPDEPSWFTAAYRRKARGQAAPVPLAEVPRDRAARLERPDLVELVRADGSSNRKALEETALALARARFRAQDVRRSARVTLAGPWPVQCDGIVSAVEIRSFETHGALGGFVTTVATGSDAFRAPRAGTQSRPPRARGGDDDREGLRP